MKGLIFKAWVENFSNYQQSYPQKIWASAGSFDKSMTYPFFRGNE